MAEEQTTAINIHCQCGANKYSCTAPNSKLPLEGGFCHCDSCRHVNGTMTFEAAQWPGKFPSDVTNMTKYPFSPKADIYFCSTCGTTMFWKGGEDDWVGFTIGTLDNAKDLVKFNGHIFVGDTKDGGFSEWLPSVQGTEMKRTKTHSEDLPLGWKEETSSAASPGDTLKAHCLCKGVQFSVTRPRKDLENPELIEPSAKQRGTWWLDPESGNRYLAGNCVCESCRLSAGNDIMSWAFIPDENIILPDGSPLSLPASWGTIKTYKSSPDVLRYFCGTCGASVLYTVEKRLRLPDVAIGLFEAEEGAMAESWLYWHTNRVSYMQEGLDRGVLAQDFLDGMKQWKERNAK